MISRTDNLNDGRFLLSNYRAQKAEAHFSSAQRKELSIHVLHPVKISFSNEEVKALSNRGSLKAFVTTRPILGG